ncbi:MAG: uroporphyrinogen-III C-methyltransferase [Actinomycetota bacterium]|nr:uroporphyrinogen-III C-methyltransferase [Actinomycetota bacterium]
MTPRRAPASAGSVTLVGAGPGDPGLLTLRGLGALRSADAVVYDRLVASEILDFLSPDAERIYAGKATGRHAMRQEDINTALIRLAREGKNVVRLKGGDPFLFGRGGEECEALASAGIGFEVVPGVTSAIAGPAAAGIPVTHREMAASVAIVTAHEASGGAGVRLDWDALARIDTVVLLMGVDRLAEATNALMRAGRPRGTPAAVVASATLPSQRTVVGTLGTIAAEARRGGITPPAVTVVGDVASLRERFGGWDTRPLSGVSCLVTRTREQASELSGVLRELGADVVEAPSIRVEPPRAWTTVDRAIAALARGTYDWTIFTSANGVRIFFGRLGELRLDARAFGGVQVAAIGTGTAAVLAAEGIRAELVPDSFTTEAVGVAFPAGAGRVLLARADVGEPGLEEAITAKGWHCDRVVVYRLRSVARLETSVRKRVIAGDIDVLTFASGGTVHAFMSLLGTRPPPSVKVACIGPVTAKAAREVGLRVDAIADEHTISGLAAATVAAAAKGPRREKRKMSVSPSRTKRR